MICWVPLSRVNSASLLRGVYSIGIVMCVLCVNVFIVVEELWEGFETAFSTYLASLLRLLYAAILARGAWEGSLIIPRHKVAGGYRNRG